MTRDSGTLSTPSETNPNLTEFDGELRDWLVAAFRWFRSFLRNVPVPIIADSFGRESLSWVDFG
jgi:hypothetical protein